MESVSKHRKRVSKVRTLGAYLIIVPLNLKLPDSKITRHPGTPPHTQPVLDSRRAIHVSADTPIGVVMVGWSHSSVWSPPTIRTHCIQLPPSPSPPHRTGSRRKLKCDGLSPACGHCQNADIPCTYDRVLRKRGPPKGSHRALKGASGEGSADDEVQVHVPVSQSSSRSRRNTRMSDSGAGAGGMARDPGGRAYVEAAAAPGYGYGYGYGFVPAPTDFGVAGWADMPVQDMGPYDGGAGAGAGAVPDQMSLYAYAYAGGPSPHTQYTAFDQHPQPPRSQSFTEIPYIDDRGRYITIQRSASHPSQFPSQHTVAQGWPNLVESPRAGAAPALPQQQQQQYQQAVQYVQVASVPSPVTRTHFQATVAPSPVPVTGAYFQSTMGMAMATAPSQQAQGQQFAYSVVPPQQQQQPMHSPSYATFSGYTSATALAYTAAPSPALALPQQYSLLVSPSTHTSHSHTHSYPPTTLIDPRGSPSMPFTPISASPSSQGTPQLHVLEHHGGMAGMGGMLADGAGAVPHGMSHAPASPFVPPPQPQSTYTTRGWPSASHHAHPQPQPQYESLPLGAGAGAGGDTFPNSLSFHHPQQHTVPAPAIATLQGPGHTARQFLVVNVPDSQSSTYPSPPHLSPHVP
ncbi:hypothetical protein M427DRAFT_32432 [Gonapodya prolifera JEL478]|uniref:Zn(2)-C6 fungal-type domain-containing protein n=1 Tax=Gonapodya prolifera (strain JEL478) TaxID=1344416 RepID=A0A139AF93_GONPJ|nr:hypothetical protein M427DRAFT_32432 [Gonapodya prolifera JEL478]|eukprot:KXS15492.1 hypothetical protein M427DRAFT_32432 [Gonapodya prolifera JEL478]